MKLTMIKRVVLILMLGITTGISATSNPFTVTPPAAVQGMVAGSSQQLLYSLSSLAPKSSPVIVQCTFTPTNPSQLSYSFNDAGCVTGVGLFHGLQPVETLLTLTVAPGATGPQTGTLTFTQVGGMQYRVPYSLSIPVVANADRTITFKNYCTNPMGGAEGSGVVIGITTSATPALNISTSNTQCNTDSDCQNFTFSKCVSGVCGGGACMSDSDCNNSHTGTCHAPAPGKSAQCTYCASDSDCMAGSVCSNNQCFWSIPTPGGSGSAHYVLAPPSGGTIDSTTITIPDYSQTNGYTLQWGGGFSGRTGCTYSGGIYTCNTADCNNSGVTPSADGEGACAVGVGFNTPSTSSEPTFVAMSPDTYDVTIINGATIGMTMYPTNAPTPQAYNNPYLCGAPGSASGTATSAGTLGACSWNFVLPTSGGDTNYAYNWVADGGGNCSTNDDCTSPAVCGLSTATITANSLPTKTCGTQLGFLNQNEMCKINASFVMTDVVDCTATYSGNTVLNLLACTGDAATSCYSETGPNTTCCGCTNWQTQGLSVPSNNSIVQQCQYPNPHWAGNATKHITGQVLPNLIWLKRACPSAYVYPYDDASSTFTCPSNSSQSGVNYTIEFCPEQKVSGCYSRRANGTLSHVC